MDRTRGLLDRPRDPMVTRKQPYTSEAILKIGWRRKWQIALPAIVIAAAASWWINRLPDRYRSEALLMFVPQQIPEAFVRTTVSARGENRLPVIAQRILNRTQLEQIIRDFNLYPDHRETGAIQDAVETMRTRDIDIRPVKGDVFRLGFIADSPAVVQGVVERLVALFIVETSHDRATLAEGTDQFLEAQLEDARRKLIDNETKLAEYRRRHHGELPTQLDANLRGLNTSEMQLQVLADSLNRDRDRQLMLERSLKDANREPTDTRVAVVPDDTSKLSAIEQLERAEAALEEMQSNLTEQHPDVVTLKQTIADLRKRSEAERARHSEATEATAADKRRTGRLEDLQAELSAVERQIGEKTAEEEQLRGALVDYQRRIEGAPAREAELVALTRDYETLQQTYRSLLAKKQESAIAANLEREQTGAQFKVLDAARMPEQPFAPRRIRLYALGVLAGLAIGLTLAVVLEWFDRGLRTAEDVRFALGLPVLATLPVVYQRHPSVRRTATIVSVCAAICGSVAMFTWRFLK
jgi:protein tyrosine kinase modulator